MKTRMQTTRYFRLEFRIPTVFNISDSLNAEISKVLGSIFCGKGWGTYEDCSDKIVVEGSVILSQKSVPLQLGMWNQQILSWDKFDEAQTSGQSWEQQQTRSVARRVAAVIWRHGDRFIDIDIIFKEEITPGTLADVKVALHYQYQFKEGHYERWKNGETPPSMFDRPDNREWWQKNVDDRIDGMM